MKRGSISLGGMLSVALLLVVVLGLVLSVGNTSVTYANDKKGKKKCKNCTTEPNHGCGPGQTWDTEAKKCIPGTVPDCGKDPYKWNPFEEVYQREFITWCEPFTFDPNETLYDGMTCDEVAASMGVNEVSYCDWSEVFG